MLLDGGWRSRSIELISELISKKVSESFFGS